MGLCNSKRPSFLSPSPDSQRAPGSGQHSDSHGESSAELDEQEISSLKAQCPAQVLAPEGDGSLGEHQARPYKCFAFIFLQGPAGSNEETIAKAKQSRSEKKARKVS